MPILSRPKLISQERFDLEDFNALLSALRSDSKFWTKKFLSGENYIIKGFSVSGLGLNSATVEMDDATLIMGNNTSDFSWFTAENSPDDIVISDGDLVDGVRNYVELSLATENGTPIVKAFWDPSANGGQGQEFNQQIDTMVDLKVVAVVSQGGFSGSPDTVPLAIIDTDGAGIIKVILDKRPLFFRLGSNTDPDAEFSWVSQEEPVYNLTLTSVTGVFTAGETITIGGGVTATVVTGGSGSISMRLPSGINFSSGDSVVGSGSGATATLDSVIESFTGADKDVDDFREILSALMTEIKNMKGTRFWYQNAQNSIEGISQYINSVIVGLSTNARYSWSGTEFIITDDEAGPADADAVARLRLLGQSRDIQLTRQDGTGGSTTLAIADQEVLYIKIPATGDVDFSGAGAGATNFQVADVGVYSLSDENYWLAYREGANLYVRGYGEMQPGEEAQISDPITAQILTFIGAVDETDSDPNYTSSVIVTQGGSLVNAISELDAAASGGISNSNQDRTMKLVKGGVWNWDLGSDTLTWGASAFLQIAGLAEDVNEIAAGSAVLAADGDVAYVQAKRTAGASTLTVAVGNIASLVLTDNITILARRTGDDVLVGKSFLMKDGEYLELDGALAELNRQLGQLKLRPHETDANKARVDSSDVTLLDGNTLSRVIGDFLLSFSGAVINFTTGVILKEDDSTPLGVNFTPQTIPVGEYFWYGISLLPGNVGVDNRQLAQIQVDLADSSDAVQGDAPNSIMSGDIKLGNVQVQNNGGTIELKDVMRLGPGSGSGSGGAGADAEAEFKRRLDLSPFTYVSTTVFEIDKDSFLDGASTGGYSPGDRAFLFSAGGQTLVSTQNLDSDYLDDGKNPTWVELLVKWDLAAIDTGATYEVSRNGGNEWQVATMERVGETDTYRGVHKFADEASDQTILTDATTDGDDEFNITTQQSLSQTLVLANATDVREIDVDLLVTGSPLGKLKAKIVADDTGSPSTDPLDVLSFTNLISIPGLVTGVSTIDFSNKVLPAGTYHIVLETDQEYKDNFSTGVDSISLRVNSAGSGAATFNGTVWAASNGIKYTLKGIELDLRVRITSSAPDVIIESYGIFYDRTPGVTADGELGVDTFEFSGDVNRTLFTLVNINNPHPDLLVCHDVFRGQSYVANEGVFRIEGQDVIFDTNFFDDPGETNKLKFIQTRGAAFDTSDANANNIASILNQLIDIGDQLESVSDSMVLPKIAVPFTTIENRAQIPDLSMDLKPRFGIDRIPTHELLKIQNEVGPNGEEVFGIVNDKFNQFRVYGPNEVIVDSLGPRFQLEPEGVMEVTFYGTGLNLLAFMDASARDFRISIDGGPEGSNLWTTGTSGSGILNARNYNSNVVFPLVSGLTLDTHTIRIRAVLVGLIITGVETLTESTEVQLPPGAQLFKGKRLVKSTLTSTSYNSDFESGTLGTKGGKVLIYQKSDGTMAKSVNPTDVSQLNLGAANHANEDLIRSVHYREFGAGRTDDFSIAPFSSVFDKSFTLSDGTTNLVGDGVSLEAAVQDSLNVGTPSGTVNFTFIGTGLDIDRTDSSNGGSDTYEFLVDGVLIGTQTSGVLGRRVTKIVSGLPYGTHTVTIRAVGTPVTYGIRLYNFLIYGPKSPSLPTGAKAISEYFILADFDGTTSDGTAISDNQKIPTGTLTKHIDNMEATITGTGWSLTNFATTLSGRDLSTATNGDAIEYTFFGTGFQYHGYASGGGGTTDFTIEIDGILDASGVVRANTSNIGGGSYRSTTSTYPNPVRVEFTGLPLGQHTVKITKTAGPGNFNPGALHIITPVHSPKFNDSYILQNTISVGSQGIGDLRKFSKKDVLKLNNCSQAFGVVNSPSTTSASFVPLADMLIPIKVVGGQVEIEASATFFTSIANTNVQVRFYVDGKPFGRNVQGQTVTASNTVFTLALSAIGNLSPGIHLVELRWLATGGSTATAQGDLRMMNVREIKD